MNSYDSAIKTITAVAKARSAVLGTQWISISEASGRIAAKPIYSPVATPNFDTSAMDGYAISSSASELASPGRPLILEVCGTIAAGEEPRYGEKLRTGSSAAPCLEIMTGGIFPMSYTSGQKLDACIKIEETTLVAESTKSHGRLIKVTRPVASGENWRLAGNDVQDGQLLLESGAIVRPRHVLVLASVGISEICVWAKPHVGVWSSGEEIATTGHGHIPDANGPYLTAVLAEGGANATFLGTLPDEDFVITESIRKAAGSGNYDLLVTTGGVSVGKFDFLTPSLRNLSATIEFHGLRIRPGHPVLFGVIPTDNGCSVPIFGLPGNPGAAAACHRFLVRPYLDHLLGKPHEKPVLARLLPRVSENFIGDKDLKCAGSKTLFRHGILRQSSEGALIVEMSKEQSPAKLAPYLDANCWIRLYEETDLRDDALLVPCYPFESLAFENTY